MIHCTMDDLLAVRDGDGAAWARRHVAECPACARELERVHQRVAALRALPQFNAPRNRWPLIRAGVLGERRQRRWRHAGLASLAVAASLALIVGGKGLLERRQDADARADVATLVEQSQTLENALRSYDPTNRVLNAVEASAVAELEDRVAAIDARLGQEDERNVARGDLADLWRQRVRTMDALVQVHATRASYVGVR